MKYGFYSEQAAMRCGTVVYLMEDGTEKHLTAVDTDPQGEFYAWIDKKYVGVAIKYIRQGHQPFLDRGGVDKYPVSE